MGSTISFSVGICAYNEGKNIGKSIRTIFKQKLKPYQVLKELVVIASGCTDNTVSITERYSKRYPKIKLIIEKNRLGKASAVNKFLKNTRSKLLILQGADLLPDKNCYQIVLDELIKKNIGMVGCRVVPLDDPDTFCGFSNNFRWHLHHLINIKYPERPKVGELVAFKKIFTRIPPKTATDEASIEPLIKLQDYQVKYLPNAIVYNLGPQTLRELLSRRRSIYAGHFDIKVNYGYEVITFSTFTVIPVFLSALTFKPKDLVYAMATALLEIIARIFGYLDIKYKLRDQSIWKIAKTSKSLKMSKKKG